VTTYDLLKTLVVGLVLPPGGPLLIALVGLLLVGRRRRLGVSLTAAGLGLLLVLSLPVVAVRLVASFSATRPIDIGAARQAGAIIVPGAGIRRAVEYGGETLNRLSIERARYGARLARELGLPILVTGGRHRDAVRTEAELLADLLQAEFGVPVRWSESRSRNTAENARYSAQILLPAGIRRVVLVVHAFDVPRAVREYEAAGFEVIPAPTLIPDDRNHGLRSFFPHADALATSSLVAYEALGLLVRRLGF
jgi:uncharacterized SAM-binding protein YcdF (DUF218 family)